MIKHLVGVTISAKLTHRANDIVEPNVTQNPNQLYLEASQRLLDLQVSSFDALDRKAFQMLATASLIFSVSVSVLIYLVPDDVNMCAYMPLGIAVLAYLFVLINTGVCLKEREVSFQPDLGELECHANDNEYDEILNWIAKEYSTSVNGNQKILGKKGSSAWKAILAFYIQVVALTFAAGLFAIL